jgi:hypothetical protein
VSAFKPSPTAANTLAVKKTSFGSSANVTASSGKQGHINHQSFSSKHRARHFLIKYLNLTLLSEFILGKRKLHEHI